MRFHHTNTYSGTVDQVHAMLVDAAFREEVCESIRSIACAVEVAETASGVTVEVRQTQVARKIPPMAQKLIGEHVEIVQTEKWTVGRDGTFEMGIPGKPGHLRGTVTLQQQGGSCVQSYDGELKINVPLIGGKLEALVSDLLRKALAAEELVGVSWLGR
jgi:hypothetical protein